MIVACRQFSTQAEGQHVISRLGLVACAELTSGRRERGEGSKNGGKPCLGDLGLQLQRANSNRGGYFATGSDVLQDNVRGSELAEGRLLIKTHRQLRMKRNIRRENSVSTYSTYVNVL